MYHHCKYIIIGLFSTISISVVATERDADIHYLLNLSLEELMNIEVTAPSRRGENQLLAPGVVSVITAQEIHQFGARHLRDVLDRVVSTQIIGSHLFLHNKMSLRATNASINDSNVLLLLNGRPIRDALQGGNNPDIYTGFPLETIHHIEIIRGPGSVIYGTNATAGVVNIVTHNPEKAPNRSQVDVSVGSFNRQQVQLVTTKQSDDYQFTTGLNLLQAVGDDFPGITDQRGHVGTYQTGEKSANLVISGTYKGFSLNTLLTSSTFDNASAFFQLPSKSSHHRRNFFDVGYHYDLTNSWQASFNYTSSQNATSWTINSDTNSFAEADGTEQLFEMTLQGQFTKNFNILLGTNYSIIGGETIESIWRKSAFIQTDYLLTEKQKIIAGLQWNKPEGNDGDFSPRIGFIQGFGEHWWLKLLYSQAFRSPSLVELFADAPALLGNPKLKPEKVATTDIQLIYQTSSQSLALTLYQSIFTNIISQKPLLNSPRVVQVNKGEIDFYGLEFEGKLALSDDFTLIGNASYQQNKDDKGIKNNTFVPSVMAKLGVTYTGKPGVTLGIFNSYLGEATDLNETLGNPAINPKAKAYNLLTANLSVDTGHVWGIGKPDHSFVSLYLDNLLNEAIYAPDLNHRGMNNTIPHQWGLGVYLNYRYKF